MEDNNQNLRIIPNMHTQVVKYEDGVIAFIPYTFVL